MRYTRPLCRVHNIVPAAMLCQSTMNVTFGTSVHSDWDDGCTEPLNNEGAVKAESVWEEW